MGFYFICYVIVGMCFGIAGHIHLARQDERRMHVSMFWLNPSPLGEAIRTVATFAPVLALLTSLLQGGLWVLVTAVELWLGAMIARFVIPLSACNGLLFLTPIPLIIVFGALWGFWYI